MKNKSFLTRTLAFLLLAAMMLGLAACGDAPAAEKPASAPAAASASSGTAAAEPVTIKLEMLSWGEAPDEAIVEAALNDMTRDTIGVEVDIEFYNLANYDEQIGLKLAGNEDMDLVAILGETGSMVRQGQLMPIDDLLDQYGQNIKDVCGDLLYYGTFDGQNYGIPFMANKRYVGTLICRKDIVDECGIDPASMMTMDGIGKAYEIVSEKYPEMTMIAPDEEAIIGMYYGIDNEHVKHVTYLSYAPYLVCVNDDPTVINFYETDTYRRELDTMKAWYEAGYILKDAATTSEVASLTYYDGNLFSYISNQNVFSDKLEPVVHAGLSNITYPTYAIPISDDAIVSSETLGVGIAANCKHPEAAMKWVNMLFADSDMTTTLNYGVEGVHWQKRDDGCIEYCEGIEPGNSGWETAFNWLMGNSGVSYVFNTVNDDPDYNKKQLEYNKNAEVSFAYGFEFNPEPVEIQMAAVDNVVAKYQRALETGSVDVDEVLPVFLAEMKEAGVDDIIAEAQRQLDEFLSFK